MYIVNVIDFETMVLAYQSEVFSTKELAEDYMAEVMEDTHGLDVLIIEVSTDNLETAKIVAHS
ncbi:hypothetical protein [Enterococcus phage SSMH02]|nr:hypothetical protein [Enterococcus phage SSMH02]